MTISGKRRLNNSSARRLPTAGNATLPFPLRARTATETEIGTPVGSGGRSLKGGGYVVTLREAGGNGRTSLYGRVFDVAGVFAGMLVLAAFVIVIDAIFSIIFLLANV